MNANEPDDEERTDIEDLDARTVRALTEALLVCEDAPGVRGAADMYAVYSESGTEYTVDAREGACTCPDHEHRGARCKHIRVVEFMTGRETVPGWVDAEAINALPLRDIVAKRRRAAVYNQRARALTDGGTEEEEARGECPCTECAECDACESLPARYPCAECFVTHGAEWPAEDTNTEDETPGVEAR